MTQDKTTSGRAASGDQVSRLYQKTLASSYYALLGLHPSASVREVRQAYRDLSKLYHPDTTELPAAIATAKFQQLNEAYATISNPERRLSYDQKIGYSRLTVIQPLPNLHRPMGSTKVQTSSAYLDPTDRPLSPGEVFALFILGLTFFACLALAITIGIMRGEAALYPVATQSTPTQEVRLAVPTPLVEAETPVQSDLEPRQQPVAAPTTGTMPTQATSVTKVKPATPTIKPQTIAPTEPEPTTQPYVVAPSVELVPTVSSQS